MTPAVQPMYRGAPPIPVGGLQQQFSALAAQGSVAGFATQPSVALPSQSFLGGTTAPTIATLNTVQNARIISGASTASFTMQPATVPMFTSVPSSAVPIYPVPVAHKVPTQQTPTTANYPMYMGQRPPTVSVAAPPPTTVPFAVNVNTAVPTFNSGLPTIAHLPSVLVPQQQQQPPQQQHVQPPHVQPPPQPQQQNQVSTPQPPPTSRAPPQLTRFDSTPLEPAEPRDAPSQTPLPTQSPTDAVPPVPLTLDEQLTSNKKSLATSTRGELQVLLARRGVDFRALSHAFAGDAKVDTGVLATTTVPPPACTSELFWWAPPSEVASSDADGVTAKKKRSHVVDAAAATTPTNKRRTMPAVFQEALDWLHDTGVTVDAGNQSHRILVHCDDACVTRGGWRLLLTPQFAQSQVFLPAVVLDIVTIQPDATPETCRISVSLSPCEVNVNALQLALKRLAQRAVQRDLRDVASLAREWCTILLDSEH